VRLGIGLPSYAGNAVEPRAVVRWAVRAEALGFDAVAVHDRLDHEAWEPLATLAAVAVSTERVRLATTAIVLPARDEGLLVKQAAVVDRLSGGRLDLGVAIGNRERDYEAIGHPWPARGRRFEGQLAHLEALWARAIATEGTGDALGPAPVQRPHPRLWVGGYTAAALERAIRFAHGYLFGAPGLAMMADRIPGIRARAVEAGRPDLEIGGMAYVLPSVDPAVIEAAERTLTRYYGTLHRPFRDLVQVGDQDAMARAVVAYRDAGLDLLHLIPVGADEAQLDALAELIGLAAGR
jgi:alkanesulfonate monooxygenase SsuD/methylene tetrahydromethanopterin reductase-like flavin-dependent oxidoreductase (luciferase family)